MRVHVRDEATAHELSEFLRRRVGAIVEQASETPQRDGLEIEVSLLGSYSDRALKAEIESAVRRWAFTNGRADVLAGLDP